MVEFGIGVTSITGPTGSGKSAVIRALRWLCFNKPTGDSFLGKWGSADYVFVKLWVDGHTIARKRGRGVNAYFLDGRKLSAFKTSPPSRITDLLGVNRDNFQFQHDPAFLLALSAAQVGRELNSVISLDTIDAALALAATEVRETKSATKHLAERLNTFKEKKDTLKWTVECDKRLTELERLDSEYQRCLSVVNKLAQSVSEIDKWTKTRQRLSECVQSGINAIEAGTEYLNTAKRIDTIRRTLNEWDELERLVEVELPDLDELENLVEEYRDCEDRIHSLEDLIQLIGDAEHGLELATLEFDSASARFKKQTKGKLCPVCLQTMK